MTYDCCVTGMIDAPAQDVWAWVRFDAPEKLVELGELAAVEREGDLSTPGACRWVIFPGGDRVRERLDTWAPSGLLGYTYSLLDAGPIPVAEFTGYVRVLPHGPKSCSLMLASRFIPVGIEAATLRAQMTSLETGLIERLRARLALTGS
jgi:Polyketide cyclase / dehydrase and lipid transport